MGFATETTLMQLLDFFSKQEFPNDPNYRARGQATEWGKAMLHDAVSKKTAQIMSMGALGDGLIAVMKMNEKDKHPDQGPRR
jgi:hypothetical protein